MMQTGLIAITHCGGPLQYAVDVKASYVGIAVFERVPPGTSAGMAGVMLWADLRAHLEIPPSLGNKAGFVDLEHDEVLIPDLPGTAHGAIYKGRSYIFADGMNGVDEIVDYALLDIAIGPGGKPLSWRNRFAQSAREKIDVSFRHRARHAIANALVVFLPFEVPFDQARIEVLCETDPICLNGTVIAGRINDATIPQDGQWFKQFYYSARSDSVTVAPGGQVDVPFQLVWNADASPVLRAATFKLDADAGYLPRRRVTTDANGQGLVTVEARGLRPGDVIGVKINTEHYTAIGKLRIEVTP
jgi:hypothetical protein